MLPLLQSELKNPFFRQGVDLCRYIVEQSSYGVYGREEELSRREGFCLGLGAHSTHQRPPLSEISQSKGRALLSDKLPLRKEEGRKEGSRRKKLAQI